jgi:hypothetical protein
MENMPTAQGTVKNCPLVFMASFVLKLGASIMSYSVLVEAPVNGRIRKSTVRGKNETTGKICNDKADLDCDEDLNRLCQVMAPKLDANPEEIKDKILVQWSDILADRKRALPGPSEAKNEVMSHVLDGSAPCIRRPISMVDSRGYGATWLNVHTETHQTVDPKTGQVQRFDPPQRQTKPTLAIVRDDGQLFGDAIPMKSQPLAKLGIEVALAFPIPADRAWSGAGVKHFLAGDRPDPASIFERLTLHTDTYMDFTKSLASQGTMCQMTACYEIATYFLGAFNVFGYLWASGDSGAGKTNLITIVAETSYLGMVVLAGGSYASLRDVAGYGAVLCFDDAEAVMNVKKVDPDKRALLLAGNRRGASITVKEPAPPPDRGWITRYVDAFCPRLFSAIRLPDSVLGSRSIIVPLVRSSDPERAKRNPLDYASWPCDRRRLLDDLWAMGVAHVAELRHWDQEAAARSSLTGRALDVWRSILAVALWLQEEHGVKGLHDRMQKLSQDYQAERGELEAHETVLIAIRALLRMAKNEPEQFQFETKTLASCMNVIAQEEELAEPEKAYTNSRRVGWILRKLRFQKADDRSSRRWKTTKRDLQTIAQTYGLEKEEKTG